MSAGILYNDTNAATLTNVGSSGQIMVSNGAGSAPAFATLATGVSSVTGTANQILASPTTGSVVLSLIGPYTPATYTTHGVLVGEGTSSIVAVGPTATAGQVLQSAGAAANPAFSTATYPATTTINRILYSSANNVVSQIVTDIDGVVITSHTGIPSILANGTAGFLLTANSGAPPSWQAAPTSGIITINGDSSSVTGATVTFTGGTSGAVFTGNGTTTMTESFNFLALPATDGGGNGIITINSAVAFSLFGTHNTYIGENAGNYGASASNTVVGEAALPNLATSSNNNVFGEQGMNSNTNNTNGNCVFGNLGLHDLTSGTGNISIGFYGLNSLVSGSNNISITNYGTNNTYNGSESSNILLNNTGVNAESNVMRLGTTGGGDNQVNLTYVAGITGATPVGANSPQVVFCDNAGNLTPSTSGTAGQVLTSAGAGATPLFADNPALTSFAVFLATDAGVPVTGDGTVFTMLFDGALTSSGFSYVAGTGVLTFNVTGIYKVSCQILLGGIAAAQTAAVISANMSAGIAPFNTGFNPFTNQDANGNYPVGLECVVNATATNTMTISLQVTGGAKTITLNASATVPTTFLSVQRIG